MERGPITQQRVEAALAAVAAAGRRYWQTSPRGFGQLQAAITAAKLAGASAPEIASILRGVPDAADRAARQG